MKKNAIMYRVDINKFKVIDKYIELIKNIEKVKINSLIINKKKLT